MQTRSLQEAFERLEGAERQVDDMGRRLDNLTRHLDGLMRILTIVDPRQGSPHHTRQVAPNSGLSMTYPEPASAPGTDGSTFHDVDQSEFLSDQPMTTSVPPILDAGSVEQLRLELPASGYDQVIAIEEMTELGTALSEDNIPFPDFDHVIFNQHQNHPSAKWILVPPKDCHRRASFTRRSTNGRN
ncbi:hypothetical protein EYC84_009919 [Monilinia fructicola]|uniref:Uncharacterized protein n=1 Tax=Monilinia fructicola TaxID=38448 RepID=A0A5M9JDT9_MONFR|nr:hypothetical protein EYC84_009919 [Monilinia fructicola]